MSVSIDAGQLTQMLLCASAMINSEKQAINDLNVFPVPDGDTGTNMSLTIATAAAELRKKDLPGVDKVAEVAASALLRGARGNSGVILSLLFRGFARSLKGKRTMDGRDFALALQDGVDAAYNAVMKPAEGTILTVTRLSAAAAMARSVESNGFAEILDVAIETALTALAGTTEQNPVLKKAGVIDAGGKGWICVLLGFKAALEGKTPESLDSGEPAAPAETGGAFSKFSDEDITFTYCTEFIIGRSGQENPDSLSAFLGSRGDSLVFVEDEEIIKVHVHTDHPGQALEQALKYGQLLTVKIENMREQHTSAVIKEQDQSAPQRQILPSEKPFGFVAISAGDGISSVFTDLGVDRIVTGGQTMNPSTEDILREIDHTPADVVFVLPNNKNIILAAEQCVPLCDERKVIVLPTASIPEGIAALLAFDPDSDTEVNTSVMTEAIGRVLTAQVTYAARDSEFDGYHITEGDYMALIGKRLIGTDSDVEQLLSQLAAELNNGDYEFITLYSGQDVTDEQAAAAEALFREQCPDCEVSLIPGGQPVYYYIISAE